MITIISKDTGKKIQNNTNDFALKKPSVVLLNDILREDISKFERIGSSLKILKKDGTEIVIENYFRKDFDKKNTSNQNLNTLNTNTLLIEDSNGDYWSFNPNDMAGSGYSKFVYIDGTIEDFIASSHFYGSNAYNSTLSAGGAAAGLGAFAALSNLRSDKSDKDGGARLESLTIDKNNGSGLAGGSAEPWAVIYLEASTGSHSTTADANGDWSFGNSNPLADGTTGSIWQEQGGNTSAPQDTTISDLTPPKRPTVTKNDGAGLAGNVELTNGENPVKIVVKDKDGNIIKGKKYDKNGDVVKDKDGNIIYEELVVMTDAKGNWKFEYNATTNPIAVKQTVFVYAYDTAGNESAYAESTRVTPISSSVTWNKINAKNVIGFDLVDEKGAASIELTGYVELKGDFTNPRVTVKIGDKIYDATLQGGSAITEGKRQWNLKLYSGDVAFLEETESKGTPGKHELVVSVIVTTPQNTNHTSTTSGSFTVEKTLPFTPDMMNYEIDVNSVGVDDTVGQKAIANGFTLQGDLTATDIVTRGETIKEISVKIDGKEYLYSKQEVSYDKINNLWKFDISTGNSALSNGNHKVEVKLTTEDQSGATANFGGKDGVYEYKVDPSITSRSYKLLLDDVLHNKNSEDYIYNNELALTGTNSGYKEDETLFQPHSSY